MPKDQATYLCPECGRRVRVFVRGDYWYWENHRNKRNTDWCFNSGKRVDG